MTDVIAGVLLIAGAAFSLTAGIGLLRFPDVLARLHTLAKPQVIGLMLALVAVGLRADAPEDIGILALIAVFQVLTAPVAAHMVGRAAYRSGEVRALITDELSRDRAGQEREDGG